MDMDLNKCRLLGLALLKIQNVEFGLYGFASHLKHEDLQDKQFSWKFKKISGESFLRGDITELKATIGQINAYCGESVGLKSLKFYRYIKKRNLIVHHFIRYVGNGAKNNPHRIDNVEEYLENFIRESDDILDIVTGLIIVARQGVAKSLGHADEVVLSEEDKRKIEKYLKHAVSN